MCYRDTKCRVRIGGELSESFEVKGGLKQGCPLSTILFSLALEWVMRQTPSPMSPIRLGETTFDRFAYADDVDFCAQDLASLEEPVEEFKRASQRIGLKINESKTKVMKAARAGGVTGNINISGMTLEGTTEFKYLGSTVTSNNMVEEEVKLRIAAGSRCAWAMKSILSSSMISRTTKLQTYTVVIRPIVIYGAETWALTKKLQQRLLAFENSILRKIYSPVFDEDEQVWRRRHNQELRDLSGLPFITNIIRSMRVRWAGHVARMGEDRTVKLVAQGIPAGRRPRGRPRRRWRDNVKADLAALGVEDPDSWWAMAEDRNTWKRLVKAAKDHHDLGPVE